MFLTEEEILGTSAALNLTCDYFGQNAEMIDAFFAANAQRKFTVMGCGSSWESWRIKLKDWTAVRTIIW